MSDQYDPSVRGHNMNVVNGIISHNRDARDTAVRHEREARETMTRDAVDSLLRKPAMNQESAAKRVAEIKKYYGR